MSIIKCMYMPAECPAGHTNNKPWIPFPTRKLRFSKLICFMRKITFVFKSVLHVPSLFPPSLLWPQKRPIKAQISNGSRQEVGSPDPTSSSNSCSHIYRKLTNNRGWEFIALFLKHTAANDQLMFCSIVWWLNDPWWDLFNILWQTGNM